MGHYFSSSFFVSYLLCSIVCFILFFSVQVKWLVLRNCQMISYRFKMCRPKPAIPSVSTPDILIEFTSFSGKYLSVQLQIFIMSAVLYAKAYKERRGSSPWLIAWQTQLPRNIVAVASCWRHCVLFDRPGNRTPNVPRL